MENTFSAVSRPSLRLEVGSLLTSQTSSTSTSRASSTPWIIPPAPSPIALRSSTSSRASTRCSTSWTTPSWACECCSLQSNCCAWIFQSVAELVLIDWLIDSSTQNGGEPCHQRQQRNLSQHAQHAPLPSETWESEQNQSGEHFITPKLFPNTEKIEFFLCLTKRLKTDMCHS